MDSKATLEYFNDIVVDIAKGEYSALKAHALWQAISTALEAQGCKMQSYAYSGSSPDSQTTIGELVDRSSGVRFQVWAVVGTNDGSLDWEFSLTGFMTSIDAQPPGSQLLGTSKMLGTSYRAQIDLMEPHPFEYHFDAKGFTKQFAPDSELPFFCERFAFWLGEAIAQ